jgi:MFS family permease
VSQRRYVRSFALLQALQYLPLGLLVPVEILIMQARGLSAAQIGAVVAVLGLTTALLELPTGGLADVLGRRSSSSRGRSSRWPRCCSSPSPSPSRCSWLSALLFATGKALGSGPLESWFVDAVNDIHEPGPGRDGC